MKTKIFYSMFIFLNQGKVYESKIKENALKQLENLSNISIDSVDNKNSSYLSLFDFVDFFENLAEGTINLVDTNQQKFYEDTLNSYNRLWQSDSIFFQSFINSSNKKQELMTILEKRYKRNNQDIKDVIAKIFFLDQDAKSDPQTRKNLVFVLKKLGNELENLNLLGFSAANLSAIIKNSDDKKVFTNLINRNSQLKKEIIDRNPALFAGKFGKGGLDWYKIAGIILGIPTLIGASYAGYKYYEDPDFYTVEDLSELREKFKRNVEDDWEKLYGKGKDWSDKGFTRLNELKKSTSDKVVKFLAG